MSDKPAGHFKYDPTINLGHILTFVGFVTMIVGGWMTLDKRLVVVEEAQKAQLQRDGFQDERAAHNIQFIKDSLQKIERTVERLSDRLDKKGL